MPQTLVEAAPERMDTQLNIRISTPIRLSTIPVTPLQVIFSLITIAEIISVIIGLKELRIDVSMAVVFVIAIKKDIWVINRPRKDAMATFHKSFRATWSCGAVNNDHNQNKSVAPNERRQNKAIGVILPSLAMLSLSGCLV